MSRERMRHAFNVCGGAVCLAAAFSICCSGPAAPSASPSLVVRVVDDLTREPIVDPVFGLLVMATGPATYRQPVVGGTANFMNTVAGTYQISADYTFGYRQLDVISVVVDKPKEITLPLLLVDDLGVAEVLVDG